MEQADQAYNNMGGAMMLVSGLIKWSNKILEPDEINYTTTDEDWIMFFNEGISQCRDYVVIGVESVADIVSGTSKYALPVDCVDLNKLMITEDGTNYTELIHVPVKAVLGENEYFIFNNEINIYEPSADVTNGLKLYYYKGYAEITAVTDTIESTDDYILGYFALSRIAMQYNIDTDYKKYYSEFLNSKNELDSREVMESTEIEEGW